MLTTRIKVRLLPSSPTQQCLHRMGVLVSWAWIVASSGLLEVLGLERGTHVGFDSSRVES